MIDKQLLRLIGSNKKYIFIVVALQILGTIANIGITASICWSIFMLTKDARLLGYIYPAITALICIAVRFAVTRLVGYFKEKLARNIKKDLRQKTYNKIVELGVKDADGMSMAGLTQVGLEGIEQLDLYYTQYLPQFFFSMITPFILFAVCVGINWRVSVALLACVPLIPISIIAVSKYAKKIFAKYWGKYTSMGDVFLDSVQGLKELKIYQADQMQHDKINTSAEEFRKITMKVLVMQLASITIMDLVAFGGAGLGIALSIGGIMNGAGAVAIIQALFLILIAVEFFLPLRALGSAFHVAMNGASAGKKIVSLLNLPNPKWGANKPNSGDIALDKVTFSYDGKRNVLKDVTMTFPSRGMRAIVGESGCEKSTIVNLIIGAIQPDSGQINACGYPLDSLSRERYYDKLAVVSYNTYIFNQTVRENFELSKPDCTDQQIMSALKAVNLDSFIRENGGLDKPITEDANNISGGQKQRLALAVNMLANKEIYVFDEATSNIDIESEAIIMHNIKALSKTKSVIVISHRLANIVPSDAIYFMSDGEVKEFGSHDELMAKGGEYARLYADIRLGD